MCFIFIVCNLQIEKILRLTDCVHPLNTFTPELSPAVANLLIGAVSFYLITRLKSLSFFLSESIVTALSCCDSIVFGRENASTVT